MDIPQSLLNAFPPSRERLLELIRKSIDDDMLRDIARADYGSEADEMFAALRSIRDTGEVPLPIRGRLLEVLTLTRWCDPDRPQPPPFEPGPIGFRGHHTRLFVCALLLQAAMEIDYGDDSTLAQCLKSTVVIGGETNAALGSQLTWLLLNQETGTNSLLWKLSLLLLTLRRDADRPQEETLRELAAWVLAEEQRLRREEMECGYPDPVDLRPTWFSLQQGLWRSLNEEFRRAAAATSSDDLRTNLQLCALLIDE